MTQLLRSLTFMQLSMFLSIIACTVRISHFGYSMGTILPWINFQVAILCLTNFNPRQKIIHFTNMFIQHYEMNNIFGQNAEMSKVNHINSHYWNYKNIVFCTLLIWPKHNMLISWHEWYWNSGSPTFYLFFCFWNNIYT